MTEKQIFTPENQTSASPASGEVGSQQHIDMVNEWAATGAARRILADSPAPIRAENTPSVTLHPESDAEPQVETHKTSTNIKTNRTVATVLGASLAVGAGFAAHEAFEAPEFSEETSIYTVEPGDGIFSAAQQVEGVESIDMRDAVDHIQADPANIDVLEDGLQPGEQLIIPTSVEGYEADNK